MMESLIKSSLTLTSLILGILLIICYHNCIFGEFWQVSVLVLGIMSIIWSQLFIVMG